jgi:hypothetical protein
MIDFPASPILDQTFTTGGLTFKFDGTMWVSSPPTNAVADAPSDGLLYGRQDAAWAEVVPVTAADFAADFVNVGGDTMTGPLVLPLDPVLPLEAATKQYVDAGDTVLQDQIDLLASNLLFIGGIDVVTDAGDYTVASAIPDGPLPAADPANTGFYVIVTTGGAPAVGNIPAGDYAVGDWIVSDGTTWTRMPLGQSSVIAPNVAMSPVVGALGPNVQTSIAGLDAADALRVLKTGDTMMGPLVLALDPTQLMEAATKQYVDQEVADGIAGTIQDAPSDGVQYGRQDATWTPVPPVPTAADFAADFVNVGGDTMTGPLVLPLDPVLPLEAATKQYVDQEVAAVPVGIADAPVDTKQYARQDAAWTEVVHPVPPIAADAPSDTKLYGRQDAAWAEVVIPPSIPDAPVDTVTYARKDAAWVATLDGTEIAAADALRVAKAGDTMTGPLVLPLDPVLPLEAATKQYVDLGDAGLQQQIDLLTSNLLFVGSINVVTDVGDYTTASGLTDGALPAADPTNANFYVIVTTSGTPPAGNIPAGDYAIADWIVSNGTVWTRMPIGQPALIAPNVAMSPVVGALGADVQAAITALEATKLGDAASDTKLYARQDAAWAEVVIPAPPTAADFAADFVNVVGDTMTGPLVLPLDPVLPLEAATKQYVDAKVGAYIGDVPPATPTPGMLWWNSTNLQLAIWYDDGDTQQWVDTSAEPNNVITTATVTNFNAVPTVSGKRVAMDSSVVAERKRIDDLISKLDTALARIKMLEAKCAKL